MISLTNDDIIYECSKMRQSIEEYRDMVDECMKFMEVLAGRGVARFWEKLPWSANIHRSLADDYDELMRLVKDLRNATPRGVQHLLPGDVQLTKFPRASLLG